MRRPEQRMVHIGPVTNKLVLDDDQDTSASPSDGTSNSYLIFWL